MALIYTFSSILLITVQLVFSQYPEFPAQNPPIRAMHTTEGGILLADAQNLMYLDSSLQTVAQKDISTSPEVISLSTYRNFIATYDVFGNVIIYNKNTLEQLQNISSLINRPLTEPLNLIGSQSTDDSIWLYIAQSVPIETETIHRHSEIDLFQFGRGFETQLREPIRFRELSRLNREFVMIFERDEFVYFLLNQQSAISTVREVRVVRICKNDTFDDNEFTAKYEIILTCLPNENKELYATHAQLINDKLVVALSTGDADSICVYSLDEIDRQMNEKYRRCVRGEDSEKAGFSRIRQVPCSRLTVVRGVCELGGYLRKGLEVSNPLTMNSIYSHNNGKMVNGMLAVEQNDLELLFIGLVTGEVYKMLLKIDRIERIHTYRVYPDIPSKLEFDEINNSVNVQTNDKVYKLPLESCDTLEGCHMCLSTQDPICGWCPILKSCTLKSECYWNSEDLPWVSTVTNNQSDCTSIELVNPPDSISVDSNIEKLEIKVNFLPIRNAPYICDFESLGTSNIIKISESSYECPLPIGFKNRVLSSSIDILVSLRDSETDLVFVSVDRTIQFFDCAKISRCNSCTDTNIKSFSCSWCVHSTTCIDSSSLSCANGDTIADTIGMCPVLYNTSMPELIHSQVPTDIILTGGFLPQPQISSRSYECVTTGQRYSARYIDSNNIECLNVTFPDPPGVAIDYVRRIQVVWNDDYFVGSIEVTTYSCSNLADDCSQCEALQFNPELSNYECSWCKPISTCHFTPFCNNEYPGESGTCPAPQLTGITPNEGPNLGGTVVSITGTNLGIQSSDILSVTIGDSTCDIDYDKYEPGKLVVCRTRGNLINTFEVVLQIRDNSQSIQGLQYTYSEPKVFELEPSIGPISGGTLVTFYGEKLLIGSGTTVQIGTKMCEIQTEVSNNEVLVCLTSSMVTEQMTTILLRIDDLMISVSQNVDGSEVGLLRFTFLPDPTVTKVTPSSMFPSGGLSLVITGTNFHAIQRASLLISYNSNNNIRERREVNTLTNCEVTDETTLSCPTPALQTGTNTFNTTGIELSFSLQLDSVQNIQGIDDIKFMLYSDPIFTPFETNLTQGASEPILIQGRNFLLNGLDVNHFIIMAGDRECETRHIQEELVICYLVDTGESAEPLFIKAQVGNIVTNIGYLELTQEQQLLKIILPAVVGCLCVLFCLLALIGLITFRRHSKKKDVKLFRLIKNLEELEMGVAQESKKGFTELQTCVEEFDQDIAGTKLPFLDMRTYLISILFPDGGEIQPGQKYRSNRYLHTSRILPSFRELLLNEEFLIQFIGVMEKQPEFGVKEKCNVASLLMVCLMSEMDYATHILKQLLSQLIDKSLVKQHPKLLLRRTDSVGEKLLTNWLAICLYGYIRDHVGTPLYRLSRALKMQLEKGPIDVVTGEARYSLSEEKLLRHVIQEENLSCFLDTGDGNGMPITFLDCDSISQAKEKALDAMYKGRPVSERPSLVEVELEYTRNKFSVSPQRLRDIDGCSESEKGWTRINTLKHYKIESGAYFQLRTRTESTKCDYVGTIISAFDKNRENNADNHLWHLSKTEDSESNSSAKDKMASEVYLHRLLYSKNVLQNFVNDLFEIILDVNNVSKTEYPLAIRYFFQVLEDQAGKHDITDSDTIQTWKNNSLALRFWVNLIKNPEFIFNIYKTSTMDSCLLVIAQTFMDSFSVTNTKLNKDSPTSKLLYAKEVKVYKQLVANYYEDVKKLPRVTEEEMTKEMNSLSRSLLKADMLDTDEALYQLFRYANKYSTQLNETLTENGYNSLTAHFTDILDQLDTNNNNNSNNPSPYLHKSGSYSGYNSKRDSFQFDNTNNNNGISPYLYPNNNRISPYLYPNNNRISPYLIPNYKTPSPQLKFQSSV